MNIDKNMTPVEYMEQDWARRIDIYRYYEDNCYGRSICMSSFYTNLYKYANKPIKELLKLKRKKRIHKHLIDQYYEEHCNTVERPIIKQTFVTILYKKGKEVAINHCPDRGNKKYLKKKNWVIYREYFNDHPNPLWLNYWTFTQRVKRYKTLDEAMTAPRWEDHSNSIKREWDNIEWPKCSYMTYLKRKRRNKYRSNPESILSLKQKWKLVKE